MVTQDKLARSTETIRQKVIGRAAHPRSVDIEVHLVLSGGHQPDGVGGRDGRGQDDAFVPRVDEPAPGRVLRASRV